MKVLVGLIALATFVATAFWLAGTVPETVQVANGEIEVPEDVYDPVSCRRANSGWIPPASP